jgi:hypothetical protein
VGGFARLFLRNPSLGLAPAEAAFAATKLINGMTMCDERREAELEHVPWAEYMNAREMSEAYQTVAVRGLTQNFVAMDANLSSTKTAITIIARLVNDLTMPGRTADRVLNGPTSDVWFKHWQAYLQKDRDDNIHSKVGARRRDGQKAVKFISAKVNSLIFDPVSNRVTGVRAIVFKEDATQSNGGTGAQADAKGQTVNKTKAKSARSPVSALPRVVPTPEAEYPDEESYYVLAVPAESAAKILAETALYRPEIFEHYTIAEIDPRPESQLDGRRELLFEARCRNVPRAYRLSRFTLGDHIDFTESVLAEENAGVREGS